MPLEETQGRTGLRRVKRFEDLWLSFRDQPSDENRNRLVEAYQELARDVVRRFAARIPKTVDRGDLFTAANFGLIGAIESFDPLRNVRFEIYAELRIRGALLDELRNEDWMPRPWRARLEQQKRVLQDLRSRLGREPFDSEVAREMEIPLEEYEFLFGIALPGTPGGSMATTEDGDELLGVEVVADTRIDQPGEELTRAELMRLVSQKMTEQEYRIVYLKYWEELPMREIGELTNLSESRVCKIHARLMERLKDRFRVQRARSGLGRS